MSPGSINRCVILLGTRRVGRRDAGQGGELVLPAIERSGPVEAWIIDDTGFQRRAALSRGDPAILRPARQPL